MNGTKIKICGIKRECDAIMLNRAAPDYAGFVFYEGSRRFVSADMALRLRELTKPEIKTVGVFVNAPVEIISDLYGSRIIDIVQLHGDEDEEYISGLRRVSEGTEVWKAYKVRSQRDIEEAAKSSADMVLLDNGYGTGERFDWGFIRGFPRPFILAGGLTPENIGQAIEKLHPFAVDVSSGVETLGVKDEDKILAAVKAVREFKAR
jgi:Phosphoribosylanthranilate isomerase